MTPRRGNDINIGNELPMHRRDHGHSSMVEGAEMCAEVIDGPDNLPIKARGKSQRNGAMSLIPNRTIRAYAYPEMVRL